MMHKCFFAVVVGVVSLSVSTIGFAQSRYYVLANDVNTNNSATLFNLNPSNGALSPIRTLQTGGEALQGGYYAGETQAISPNAACIFVADGGTSDIAAFSKATQVICP